MHKYLWLLPGTLTLLTLAGCSGGRHDPTEKYYLVATNVKIPYWQSAASGLYKAAHQMGVQAEMVGPDTYDAAGERDAFSKAVAKKPAGIMVSPADPTSLAPEIQSAISQGIPVITMDSDAPDSKRLLFIGTNNYDAGVMGGKAAVKALGDNKSVVVYTMPGQVNLQERLRGYKDIFAEHGVKIVDTVNISGDPRVAFDRTNDIVTQGKLKVDGFVCLEANACKEVGDVLDRNKVKGKTVVGMDTYDETLNWIKKGVIVATIAQKPFTMGFYGAKVLDDLHHYKPQSLDMNWAADTMAPFPEFIDTGATLIDKSNVDSYISARNAANSEKQ